MILMVFFFNDPATTEIYTLSLHDALPISGSSTVPGASIQVVSAPFDTWRSEEHTSELQSRENLVCRLLLEKKKESHFSLRGCLERYRLKSRCDIFRTY